MTRRAACHLCRANSPIVILTLLRNGAVESRTRARLPHGSENVATLARVCAANFSYCDAAPRLGAGGLPPARGVRRRQKTGGSDTRSQPSPGKASAGIVTLLGITNRPIRTHIFNLSGFSLCGPCTVCSLVGLCSPCGPCSWDLSRDARIPPRWGLGTGPILFHLGKLC